MLPNGRWAGLAGPRRYHFHLAQLQDEEQLCSTVQAHAVPQLHPSPQLHGATVVPQLQDGVQSQAGAQLQAALFISVFIGTSLVCVTDDPYLVGGIAAYLNEKANLIAVTQRKVRTCAEKCG